MSGGRMPHAKSATSAKGGGLHFPPAGRTALLTCTQRALVPLSERGRPVRLPKTFPSFLPLSGVGKEKLILKMCAPTRKFLLKM